MDNPKQNILAEIARLLAEPPQQQWQNHLPSLVDVLMQSQGRQNTPPPPPVNSLFGLGLAQAPKALGGPTTLDRTLADLEALRSLAPAPKPVAPAATIRRIFYSFHYDDVFRVNHVRNAGKIRVVDRGRYLTPQDRSLWERVKRTNPANLRRVIDARLQGTSVTCVLAGAETWERDWVRYEIARSLFRGNGLLAVHIDKCECPRNGLALPGPNPLAYLALGWDFRIYEFVAGDWHPYSKIPQRLISWPKWLPRPSYGCVMPLIEGSSSYDWKLDDGYRNLLRWTDAAAKAARR